MITKYYKITGLDEGEDITPFAVTQDDLDLVLNVHGDKVRYYEEITRVEYLRLREEVSHMFKVVIDKLLDLNFGFEVNHKSNLPEDSPIRHYLPDNDEDTRFIYTWTNNTEWVVYDYDTETLEALYDTLLDF